MEDIEYILFFVAASILAFAYSIWKFMKARSEKQKLIRQKLIDESVRDILFPQSDRSSVHAYAEDYIIDLLSEGFLPIYAVDKLSIVDVQDDYLVADIFTDSAKYTIKLSGEVSEFNNSSLLHFLKTNGIADDSLLSEN